MKPRVLLALGLAAAVLAGCGGADDAPVYEVTYAAAGPAPLDVTYGSSGALFHEQAASGSFSRVVTAREGDELFVSAQTPQLLFVTASITVNGQLLRAGAARGQASAATTCCRAP